MGKFLRRLFYRLAKFYGYKPEETFADDFKTAEPFVRDAIRDGLRLINASTPREAMAAYMLWSAKQSTIDFVESWNKIPKETQTDITNRLDDIVDLVSQCKKLPANVSFFRTLAEEMLEAQRIVDELVTEKAIDFEVVTHFFLAKNTSPAVIEMVIAYGKYYLKNHTDYKEWPTEKHRTTITPEFKEAVLQHIKDNPGKSFEEISSIFKCARSTISVIAKDAGLSKRKVK